MFLSKTVTTLLLVFSGLTYAACLDEIIRPFRDCLAVESTAGQTRQQLASLITVQGPDFGAFELAMKEGAMGYVLDFRLGETRYSAYTNWAWTTSSETYQRGDWITLNITDRGYFNVPFLNQPDQGTRYVRVEARMDPKDTSLRELRLTVWSRAWFTGLVWRREHSVRWERRAD